MDQQDGPILPAPIANQNKGFASPCPLADSAIYMYNLVPRFSLAPEGRVGETPGYEVDTVNPTRENSFFT